MSTLTRTGERANHRHLLGFLEGVRATPSKVKSYHLDMKFEWDREKASYHLLFGITIAFPGTKMFNDYAREGLIRSFNWDDYYAWTSEPLFNHRRLSHETVQRYMSVAYRQAILTNPGFLWRRALRGLRTRDLLWDLYYGLKFLALPAATPKATYDYYARDRWPRHDFAAEPLHVIDFQRAKYRPRLTTGARVP